MRALLVVLSIAGALVLAPGGPPPDPSLAKAFRRPAVNGWVFVHLEGPPREIGYQHGYLLASEIEDAFRAGAHLLTHDTKREWSFFRAAAERVFWPKVEAEYREEMEGIAAGLAAQGVNLDLWDVVALNASIESSYYTGWLDRRAGAAAPAAAPAERCSAFVATGSYTRGGRIVIGHNNWSNYADGSRWNIIFDIVPASGRRILMDGYPGFIHSGDDFGMNSAGIAITETTISQFHGFDPAGIPEFVRARKAMQYADSIDSFARIMRTGNNGGYANNWLVADTKTGEIASLELGLKNVVLRRTADGYFAGANFPVDEKLAREETDFPVNDPSVSSNARRLRWEQLMQEHKGRIDTEAGKRFLADHYDAYARKQEPNERTLCGHIDLSPRGLPPWQPPFGPAGAVQSKVADASMIGRMSLAAAAGHACGMAFKAGEHRKRHPEFGWQRPYLRDLDPHPWTVFESTP